MATTVNTDNLRGTAFGDLHLLAGHRKGYGFEKWIPRWRDEMDLCVLNGDIFDFRWAEPGHPEKAAEKARTWLEYLVRPPVRSRFLVVMGNHDAILPYRSVLEALTEVHPHFKWAEHWGRMGDKVFFHGDFPDESGEVETLRNARRDHGLKHPPGKGRRGLYWVATQVGLTGAFPRALPWQRYCRQSDHFLSSELGAAYDGISDVYLGHTHVHFKDLVFNGRRFHNSGAPLRGAAFNPISFLFDEADWRNLTVG